METLLLFWVQNFTALLFFKYSKQCQICSKFMPRMMGVERTAPHPCEYDVN